MNVGIFGSWRPLEGNAIYEEAREVGYILARNGHKIITGGYSGVMEASSRGAHDAGGVSIGVTCPEIDKLLPPNPWLTQRVPTSDLLERLSVLLRMTDAAIFFPGRTGTISEIALATELRKKEIIQLPLLLMGNYWLSFFEWTEEIGTSLVYPQDPDTLTVYKIINKLTDIIETLGTSS